MEERRSMAIGNLAVQLGFLTREEVEEARANLPSGRSFDEHLLDRGALTPTQVETIQEELLPARISTLRFGEILVRGGWVSPEAVEEGLRIQKELAEEGEYKRIGQILLESDVLAPGIIVDVLKVQDKTMMTCQGCRSHFNVRGFEPGRRFRCRHCGMLMTRGADDIFVDETIHDAGETPRISEEGKSPAPEYFGKFRLERLLGSLQMRPVYHAVEEGLDRVVALHIFSREEAGELEDFGDFRHPRIIPILEMGEHDGKTFVATEHVPGKTLDEMRVEPRKGIGMVRDAARALHEAHRKGLAHRNIHPRNIMLGEDGDVRLMNFGLPPHPHKTAALSPEQERGEKGDARSDVWSLAATLRLLPGSIPGLETVYRNAMHRDPKKRYPDAGALADDLDRALRGEKIVPRSWSAGKKIAFTLAGILLVAGALAAGYSLMR